MALKPPNHHQLTRTQLILLLLLTNISPSTAHPTSKSDLPHTSTTVPSQKRSLPANSPVLVIVPIIGVILILFLLYFLYSYRKRKRQTKYFAERKDSVRRSRILEARKSRSFMTSTTEVSSVPSIFVEDGEGGYGGEGGGVVLVKGRGKLDRIEEGGAVEGEEGGGRSWKIGENGAETPTGGLDAGVSDEEKGGSVADAIEMERREKIRILSGEEEKKTATSRVEETMGSDVELEEPRRTSRFKEVAVS